jgi:pimeloyl-ACP methyl ester carboxylesterase
VEVVIHSYRHRYGYAPGDPALESIEQQLAGKPLISIPTIVLDGADDGVSPTQSADRHAAFFSDAYQRRVIPAAGHNLPQEQPQVVVQAVQELLGRSVRVK